MRPTQTTDIGVTLVERHSVSSTAASGGGCVEKVTMWDLLRGNAKDDIPSIVPHFFSITSGQFLKVNHNLNKSPEETRSDRITIESQFGIVGSLLSSLAGSVSTEVLSSSSVRPVLFLTVLSLSIPYSLSFYLYISLTHSLTLSPVSQ